MTADELQCAGKAQLAHRFAHACTDEGGEGEGIKESGAPRSRILLTGKLRASEYGEGATAGHSQKGGWMRHSGGMHVRSRRCRI